jgi:hypothetical protein
MGLLLNTGGFFISEKEELAGNETDIPKELSVMLYPLVAADKIKWVDWDMVPGVKVPAPGAMEEFYPGYDGKFSVAEENRDSYRLLFRSRIQNRIGWMANNGIEAKYVKPLKKIIGQ